MSKPDIKRYEASCDKADKHNIHFRFHHAGRWAYFSDIEPILDKVEVLEARNKELEALYQGSLLQDYNGLEKALAKEKLRSKGLREALKKIEPRIDDLWEEVETQEFGNIKICDRTAFSISVIWADLHLALKDYEENK